MCPAATIGLWKVVSGGQTGVDQAALRAAIDCGLATGGWCPPGCLSEAGPIPSEFGLKETPADVSPEAPGVRRSLRTEWNVRDSDATLVVCPGGDCQDIGTAWAIECASRYGRPLLVQDSNDPASARVVAEWLRRLQITTLNVAGPSESSVPPIGGRAYGMLKAAFAMARGRRL